MTHRCSFCNRAKPDVKHLVQGQKGLICEHCIKTCVETLEREFAKAPLTMNKPTDAA